MTLSLIADIGGTNARFALWDGHSPSSVLVLAPADFQQPADAVRAYLARVGKTVDALQSVCLACAGPVQGDHFQFTNNAWSMSRSAFCQELGLKELVLINDFAAQAMGMSRVEAHELLEIRPGVAQKSEPRLIIGPGTGLGVGTLLCLPDGRWKALPGEGGHVDLPVNTLQESRLWATMHARFGHVSAEHVLSGSGMLKLYQAFCEVEGWTPVFSDPSHITDAALDGDEQALSVVEQFCIWLGRVAGNNVLTLGARGGVYITGGIAPRIVELLRKSGFTRAFADKGQMSDYFDTIPVWLVTAKQPGLVGAGVALQQRLDEVNR
ncbi:glucokinase [Pseudomonas matsuisoli]|uniref:Glucokinase n=1 Tax=Pseudomonas matsuisoli TaxID=1515666 RepID=A0A917PU12_9PSED|nr:glucokinase [Pseudomonas matsuisoli]GGJ91570.1 glucokinase [Pseudomonas matsuisoli]